MSEQNRQQQLDNIANELQSWVDFRADQKPPISDDTHIISPPHWPTVGTLRNWISVLRKEG